VKWGKTGWLLLIAGIIIFAGISLGMTRAQQADQQKSLQMQLNQARQRIARIKLDDLAAQKGQLSQQLTYYNSEQKKIAAMLTCSMDSIDVTNAILEDSTDYSVNIEQITSSNISTTDLAGIKCEALSLNLKASGNIRNIVDFVVGLNHRFPTGIIKSTAIDINNLSAAPNNVSATETPIENAQVNVNFVIYNYKGK
jgi:hypothetical protein